MAKLDSLTVDELLAENERLMAEKEQIRDEQRELQAELSRRADQAAAERAVEGLSPGAQDVVRTLAAGEAKAGKPAG